VVLSGLSYRYDDSGGNKHLGRRYADLHFLLREEPGLIPQGTLKGR
jgi:hypothetical protein